MNDTTTASRDTTDTEAIVNATAEAAIDVAAPALPAADEIATEPAEAAPRAAEQDAAAETVAAIAEPEEQPGAPVAEPEAHAGAVESAAEADPGEDPADPDRQGPPPEPPRVVFADLGLSEEVLRAIADMGYRHPTPIQEQAIPFVLMGRDVMGTAQTGTGKTAGFTLPMLDILSGSRARARMPRSLILEPTREWPCRWPRISCSTAST